MKEAIKDSIKEIIREAIDDGVTAGANLLVLRDGVEELYCDMGYANREQQQPIGRDTIFRLFSMTKPVTAAAAMKLMEQGKLDIGQPVAEILPGFRDVTYFAGGKEVLSGTPVTVLHLLNMTSGLSYGDEDSEPGRRILEFMKDCQEKLYTEQAVTTVEFANGLGRLPLNFEPASSWRYGLSADVLGAVIEVVSGMRFGDYLKKYLFEPLRMEDTDFWVPAQKQKRLATVYESTAGGKMIPYYGDHLEISNKMEFRPAFESGGAGLVSTIDDYARFAQMLLNGGVYDGTRILEKNTVEYLTAGSLNDRQQAAFANWIGLEGFTYSHLMRIMADPGNASGLAVAGEYGWDGWLGCYFANLPNEKMTILLMQQKKDSGTISMTRRIRNVILKETSRKFA